MKYNISTCFSRSALAGLKLKPSSDDVGGGRSRAYWLERMGDNEIRRCHWMAEAASHREKKPTEV